MGICPFCTRKGATLALLDHTPSGGRNQARSTNTTQPNPRLPALLGQDTSLHGVLPTEEPKPDPEIHVGSQPVQTIQNPQFVPTSNFEISEVGTNGEFCIFLI